MTPDAATGRTPLAPEQVLDSVKYLPSHIAQPLLASHEALRAEVAALRDERARFIADLKEIESAYECDGVAHMYASRIEKVFDRWLHEELP